jgi:hypothetical protein
MTKNNFYSLSTNPSNPSNPSNSSNPVILGSGCKLTLASTSTVGMTFISTPIFPVVKIYEVSAVIITLAEFV